MAILTVTTVGRGASAVNPDGVAVAAAGGGDSFVNTGVEFLYIKNAGVGAMTLTYPFVTTLSVDGQDPPDPSISVTNGQNRLIGPFPVHLFNDTNGRVNLTYSGVTSVTVAPLKLGA